VNKALFWLNKVLNDPEPTLRQDIFVYARLVNLVVHYELGNYDLLEYIVRSTHRFLSKRHRAHKVETLLIESVKKMARAQQASAKLEHAKALLSGLQELMKDPNEGTVLKYFDFLSWARSKVEGTKFADVVAAQARRVSK
jgi:uncharacterized protein (DUF2132 family)